MRATPLHAHLCFQPTLLACTADTPRLIPIASLPRSPVPFHRHLPHSRSRPRSTSRTSSSHLSSATRPSSEAGCPPMLTGSSNYIRFTLGIIQTEHLIYMRYSIAGGGCLRMGAFTQPLRTYFRVHFDDYAARSSRDQEVTSTPGRCSSPKHGTTWSTLYLRMITGTISGCEMWMIG